MSQRFKITFDGVSVNEPDDGNQYISTIKKDAEYNAIFIVNDSVLTFTKREPEQGLQDAYEYIESRFLSESFCTEIVFKMYEDCSGSGNFDLINEGLIKLINCEFNLSEKTVKIKIIDDSFFARIKNNAEINTSPLSGKSKNAVDIDVPPVYELRPINPCDGTVAILFKRQAFKVFDIMKFFVESMTDDTVAFESPVYGVGGEFEYLTITTGEYLRLSLGDEKKPPMLNFKELYLNLKKKHNLGFYIRIDSGKPVLVVDYDRNIFVNSNGATIDNVREIKRTIDKERLYARVKFGGSVTDGDGTCDVGSLLFNEDFAFIGFKEEEYFVLGQCNGDSVLDLQGSYNVDTNTIQDVVFNSNDGFDEEIFFVDGVDSGAPSIINAHAGDIYVDGSAHRFFNLRLSNYSVSNYFAGGVPQDIVQRWTVVSDVEVEATQTTAIENTTVDIPFPNIIYNPSGYFDGTFFTAPATGIYQFRLTGSALNPFVANWNKYTSGGTPIGVVSVAVPDTGTDPLFTFSVTASILLDAGEKISAGITGLYVFAVMIHFYCDGMEGYRIAHGYDLNQFKAIQYQFKDIITRQQYMELEANYRKKVVITNDCGRYLGWVDELTYNRYTNECSITLIGAQYDV